MRGLYDFSRLLFTRFPVALDAIHASFGIGTLSNNLTTCRVALEMNGFDTSDLDVGRASGRGGSLNRV